MTKKAIDLKIEAESYLWKYGGDDEDKKIATKLFIEAINKNNDGSMNNIQYADCYARLAFSYIDRIDKDDDEDFEIVLKSFEKILTINLPSWFDKSNIISLLINPCRFGFNIKHKNVEYAKKIGVSNMDAGTLYQIACIWAGYNDATEEEINFAYYYYDHIVKHGVNYHNYTHAMAYCRMAMIYAYNKEKSIENFNKACGYFKMAINTPNFLESHTDQVCIPYCQYAIFLSRARDFGFPKECENKEEGKEYEKKIEELCNKDPSSLYYKAGEQYTFHKFANKEYFDISIKYYLIALNLNNTHIDLKMLLNNYLGYIYTEKIDKNIDNYIKGINYHYETVILSLNNHKLNNLSISSMQSLLFLLYDPEHFNFDILYMDDNYVKVIKENIKNIKDNYDTETIGVLNRVIDVFHKVNSIKLKKNDVIFKERQKKIIDNYINNIQKNETLELNELMNTKEKLSLIEENSELYEYYDGFMRTFVQVYAVSIIIKSGQLLLNNNDIALTISTKLISLIPLLGNNISSTVEGVIKFIKSIEMVNKAVNIVKFSTTAEQFNELVQDAIVDIIIKNKDKLLKIQEYSNEKSLRYYEKIQNFCETMKINLEESIYVQELETPMQKIGSSDATKLISDFLSNGKIYNNELSIKIPLNIKKERLTNYALIICFDKEEIETNKENDKDNKEEIKINKDDIKINKEEDKNGGVEVVNIDSCSYMEYFYNFSWRKKTK